jgi:uncharacterized membrane-anchored protein YjiN (DUF445 family)
VKRRQLGHASLAAVATGFVATEGLMAAGALASPAWRILATGFEAGTVGALADWYAVHVLFHPAPLPLRWLAPFRDHADLVARNRPQIAAGIVDMVENHWLSREAVRAKLEAIAPAELLLSHFDTPGERERLVEAARRLVTELAPQLGREDLAVAFERALRGEIASVDLARPLGKALELALEQGDLSPALNAVLRHAEDSLEDDELARWLSKRLASQADAFAQRGILASLAVRLGEATQAIDYDVLSRRLLALGAAEVARMRSDAKHPVRRKIDARLAEVARSLSQGDPAATAVVERLRAGLAERLELREAARAAELGRRAAGRRPGERARARAALARRDVAVAVAARHGPTRERRRMAARSARRGHRGAPPPRRRGRAREPVACEAPGRDPRGPARGPGRRRPPVHPPERRGRRFPRRPRARRASLAGRQLDQAPALPGRAQDGTRNAQMAQPRPARPQRV